LQDQAVLDYILILVAQVLLMAVEVVVVDQIIQVYQLLALVDWVVVVQEQAHQ
jgi:hypothetical protein